MCYLIGIINLADLRPIEIVPGSRDRGTNEVDGGRMVGGGRYTHTVLYNNNSMVANHHLKSISTPPKFFTRPIFYPSTTFFYSKLL